VALREDMKFHPRPWPCKENFHSNRAGMRRRRKAQLLRIEVACAVIEGWLKEPQGYWVSQVENDLIFANCGTFQSSRRWTQRVITAANESKDGLERASLLRGCCFADSPNDLQNAGLLLEKLYSLVLEALKEDRHRFRARSSTTPKRQWGATGHRD